MERRMEKIEEKTEEAIQKEKNVIIELTCEERKEEREAWKK